MGAGELAAAVHAATDGLAAVALAAISPELLPGCLYWIEGYPGFPAGISEAELAERAAVQAGTLAAQEVQLAGGPCGQGGGAGVVTLADGSAIATRPVAGGAGAAGLAAPAWASSRGRHPLRPAADGRPALGRRAAAQREPAVRPHERERRRALPARGAVPR